ncbi:MAG: Uma2 family endonuclease [Chloroflexota bacterium]
MTDVMTQPASKNWVLAENTSNNGYANGNIAHQFSHQELFSGIKYEIRTKAYGNRAHLPTFPMDVGWREIYEKKTNTVIRWPLTLLDILYPTEADIGVVFVAQNFRHDHWSHWLKEMITDYCDAIDDHEWLVLNDVLIYWDYPGISPISPDITVIPNTQMPAETYRSYRVGRDGPLPTFVIEITSHTTRDADLNEKRIKFAAAGVKEYLIVDTQTPPEDDWRLLGYSLEPENPYYQQIAPDENGGVTFKGMGLRFVPIERNDVHIYDISTGERLLTPPERKKAAEVRTNEAEVRANEAEVRTNEAEARARQAEEQRIQEKQQLEAEIARLQALLQSKSSND